MDLIFDFVYKFRICIFYIFSILGIFIYIFYLFYIYIVQGHQVDLARGQIELKCDLLANVGDALHNGEVKIEGNDSAAKQLEARHRLRCLECHGKASCVTPGVWMASGRDT